MKHIYISPSQVSTTNNKECNNIELNQLLYSDEIKVIFKNAVKKNISFEESFLEFFDIEKLKQIGGL
jgi:hypothetical protein